LVLQALPLGQLTKLDLDFGSREPLLAAGESRDDKLQQFTVVIAQMSQLRSLSLQLVTEARAGAETLLQGVTTLGSLTELQLAPLGSESGGLQPPLLLRRLACDVPANVAPLRLAHLTQLTELGRMAGGSKYAHTVVADDQLPTSLQQLVLEDIESSEPLVG
jgi:hypothetical protein